MPSARFILLTPVQAIQVTATNLAEVATFAGGTVLTPTDDLPSVLVQTLKGPQQAYVGSYVLQKGTKFGVVSQDIFEALYQ
jgi:hypothetical protein